MKGNDQVKHTAQLLSDSKHINYMGYVEGDDIFAGEADVVVCDGFVGNVALKSMEGMAKLIGVYIKKELKRNWSSQLTALLSYPVLRRVRKSLDPNQHNGASFLGLQGIVIKSHGSASQKAFAIAIEEAIIEVEKNVPQRIGEEVGVILEEAEFV
ncbi:MAG: phosphate acyltransferase, partial [Gammaproteobacteria bacterium]|nr:phosphate acyltransferase [Gammaproteobacteria bacterium]